MSLLYSDEYFTEGLIIASFDHTLIVMLKASNVTHRVIVRMSSEYIGLKPNKKNIIENIRAERMPSTWYTVIL